MGHENNGTQAHYRSMAFGGLERRGASWVRLWWMWGLYVIDGIVEERRGNHVEYQLKQTKRVCATEGRAYHPKEQNTGTTKYPGDKSYLATEYSISLVPWVPSSSSIAL